MNTACSEASLIEKLFTLKTRSSFGKLPALAANTTPFTGVGGIAVAGARPTGLPEVNSVPVPSSFIVTVPTAEYLGSVTVRVNVSPLSSDVSLVIATRTSKLPLASSFVVPWS